MKGRYFQKRKMSVILGRKRHFYFLCFFLSVNDGNIIFAAKMICQRNGINRRSADDQPVDDEKQFSFVSQDAKYCEAAYSYIFNEAPGFGSHP